MSEHGDDELRRLARAGRDALDGVEPAALDRVWAGVDQQLDADEVVADEGARTTGTDGSGAVGHERGASGRRRGRLVAVAATAAALVVGLAVGSSLRPGGDLLGGEQVASVELTSLEDGYAPVAASLVEHDGGRSVEVALDGLPSPEGFHEVWLLGEGGAGMVSLGPVRADGSYVVPDTVDLVTRPTLDVSLEPDDGDPAHSGRSVLRGTFSW